MAKEFLAHVRAQGLTSDEHFHGGRHAAGGLRERQELSTESGEASLRRTIRAIRR